MRQAIHVLAIPMLVAALLTASPARAAGEMIIELPAGWGIDGSELVWTSESPLRVGGARYEFRSGNRLLGFPIQRGNNLRLGLSQAVPLIDLSVWAAGRRIDLEETSTQIARSSPPGESRYR